MKALTSSEMSALDNAMVELGIDVPRMMELAGLFVAVTAAKMLRRSKTKKILVMAGTGNNGGDALAAARHLINWGYSVDVALATSAANLKPIPLQQWKILVKMKARLKKVGAKIRGYGLIVDGLLGYSISGNPRESFAELISAANNSKIPVLAIDVPSGLDATTGRPYEPCIKAAATISLTAPKKGLLKKSGRKCAGRIFVAYMTVPGQVRKRFGLSSFSEDSLIVSQPR